MRTREEIYAWIMKDKGRPNYESGILEVLLDIRDLFQKPLIQVGEIPRSNIDLLSPSDKGLPEQRHEHE